MGGRLVTEEEGSRLSFLSFFYEPKRQKVGKNGQGREEAGCENSGG